MSDKQDLISIGYYNGEIDFAVNGSVINLTQEQMHELRAMIVVAIGTMEDMWRLEQQRNMPSKTTGVF